MSFFSKQKAGIRSLKLVISYSNSGSFDLSFFKTFSTSFAIVVDTETYNRVNKAIDAYKKSIENDSLSTYILIDDWKQPDNIRAELIK